VTRDSTVRFEMDKDQVNMVVKELAKIEAAIERFT
jgi:hypothetical protein